MPHSWVEISLSNLLENYRRLLDAFPGRIHCPVLKSDAYGHGAVESARLFAAEGCTHFCVFSAQEALELREAGITQRLFVMGGISGDGLDCIEGVDNAAWSMWDLDSMRRLSDYGVKHGRIYDCHLKIDTGMSRLGFFPEEVPEALALGTSLPGIRITGAFTHLATAACQSRTQIQCRRFRNAVADFPAEATELHLSATPGMMACAAPEFPLIRPGVALYGYGLPRLRPDLSFLPVMSFHSRLISVKEIKPGEHVSYGGLYTVEDTPRRIGVVPAGYSDGYPRSLGNNRAEVLVRGQRATIRGRICMGMMMVDVTHIPGVQTGDQVTLLGEQGGKRIDAVELSGKLGTIPYEILCSLGKHKDRRFIK
ncbi:MAG: alanine racemase [Victivallales bacterium]|nr:alanine racemase [Victivallales bacterium]